jgi:hypothetical protein
MSAHMADEARAINNYMQGTVLSLTLPTATPSNQINPVLAPSTTECKAWGVLGVCLGFSAHPF